MSDHLRFLQESKKHLTPNHVLQASKSFYQFPHKSDKDIFVCTGTACLTKKNQTNLITELENISGSTVQQMSCMGLCHKQNAFSMHGKSYSLDEHLHLNEVYKNKDYIQDNTPLLRSNIQILTEKMPNLDEFYNVMEKYFTQPKHIVEECKISNLRGRGGAGFPFGLKLESCANTENDCKYIVCNADEGDPGAFSDKYLLEYFPHKVLFGMYASAIAVGANIGYLYIRAEYPESIKAIEIAIKEFEQTAAFKKHQFEFRIYEGHGAYICGEETALLNSIEGLRPEVRIRPPFPTIAGLFNKPTVLSNVETFANIPWILKYGGAAFAKIGSEKSKGSKLICLDGHFQNPGILEVTMGTSLHEVIFKFGGGFKTPIKALQIGGPLGGVVPIHLIETLNCSFESFQERGFLFGHGSIIAIPEEFPMIKMIQHLFDFTASESCGKCFPCRIGSTQGSQLIGLALTKQQKINRSLFEDLLFTMKEGSLCALGGGLPLPIQNILTYFPEELSQHFQAQ